MYLIDCPPHDPSGMLVKQRLDAAGQPSAFINIADFPQSMQLSYNPVSPESGTLCLPNHPRPIGLETIRGVFRRGSEWISTQPHYDFMLPQLVYWNMESALGSLYRLLTNCTWMNSLETFNAHYHKGFQLHQFGQLGIRIPRTLITNRPEDVVAFFEQEQGQVIVKYPFGGKETIKLTYDNMVHPSFAAHLQQIPIKIQECIVGMDIRVYVVGDTCFALEIQTDALDFRETPHAFRKPITLPKTVEQQCLALCKTLGLLMAGIDIKRTTEGEYVFLEANPSPVFLYDEVSTGYPISQKICDFLIA